MDNPVNRLRIAWALVDCGWGTPSPPRYESVTFNATNDGKVDPRLVVVVVAATLSPDRVAECMSRPPAPAVSSQQASH